MMPGLVLVFALGVCGLLLLLKTADHSRTQPTDHVLVVAVAILSAAIAVRFFDVLDNMEAATWPSAFAALAFAAVLWREKQRKHAERLGASYAGVDRRAPPRPGTDPDEPHARRH